MSIASFFKPSASSEKKRPRDEEDSVVGGGTSDGNIAEKHGGYTAGDEANYEKIVVGLLAEAAK
jgi:hypothetical protein